jgi:hypothetical protein
MVRQSTKPEATAYPESPRSATQERASITAQPTWPRTRKSRLSILPEVDDKGNEVEAKDNTNIFTHENFRARFAADVDGLFATILGIIQEHDSLLEELNALYIETNIQIGVLVDENDSLQRTIIHNAIQGNTGDNYNSYSSKSTKLPDLNQLDNGKSPFFKS